MFQHRQPAFYVCKKEHVYQWWNKFIFLYLMYLPTKTNYARLQSIWKRLGDLFPAQYGLYISLNRSAITFAAAEILAYN